MTDPLTALRDADPAADLAARPPSQLRERILAEPRPAGPSRASRLPRRLPRLALGAGLAALLAVALVAASPWTRSSSPDVIARAAAAYSDPNAVVHFKLQYSGGGNVQPLSKAQESWQTVDGRRERTLIPASGLQIADDRTAGTYDTYVAGKGAIKRENPVDRPTNDPPPTLGAAGGTADPHVGDVTALLQQARDGRDGVEYVGETTVRDIPVYELRFAYTNTSGQVRATAVGLVGPGAHVTRTIYLDRETYLPVRLVEAASAGDGPPPDPTTVDFIGIEKLRPGAATDKLLKLDVPAGTPIEVRPPFDDSKATGTP